MEFTNQEMFKVTPKNDIVFKKIFGTKGNERILQDFLEAILDIKINSLKLDLNTEILPDFYDGKTSRLDVLARLDDGTLVDIEVQVNVYGYSEKRCLEYWSKLYTKELEKGEDYVNLNKTICVWIVDGTVYDEFKEFESTWKISEEKYGIKGHFKDFEIHVIELKKFRENAIMNPKKKEFWLWFIDHTNREMIKMGKITEERLNEAYEEYMRITSDKAMMTAIINRQIAEQDEIARNRRAMEAGLEEGRAKGRAEGRAEGLKEGKEEGKKEGIKETREEMAKKLLALKMDINQIAEITELSIEEIEKLK
ncbi:MAG: Rpn family recombination-promoting nuclease/putative transposase [Clostridia bacterium]|nr:Rpn family recombination-promoting nuclease/putative transposase [Clostridia bacterium]